MMYCKSEHITIYFVTAPLPDETLKSVTNYAYVNETIKKIMETKHFKWLDFNTPSIRQKLQLNTMEDFDDANHLSQNGVIKFNELLINLLQKDSF
jgi:trehalose/maltose hydrolase-like predicted phosphorylase